jgi:hypothetical protein
MAVAFACFSGRAGPLSALILVIIGTIFYELNRQIISKLAVDYGGSMSIFCFGGFMGSAASLILYFSGQRYIINKHKEYTSSKMNATIAMIGAAFCWVFFPFLSIDIPVDLFIGNFAGVNTIYSVSSCVLTTIGLNLVFYGHMKIRDMLYSPIAGGVIIGSSSVLIYNPMASILLGLIAAFSQCLFNFIDRKMVTRPIFSNNGFFLFAIQGLFGGLASAVMRAISMTSTTVNFNTLTSPY